MLSFQLKHICSYLGLRSVRNSVLLQHFLRLLHILRPADLALAHILLDSRCHAWPENTVPGIQGATHGSSVLIVSERISFGMITLLPLNRVPSSTVISSLSAKYGLISSGSCSFVLGQPDLATLDNFCMLTSLLAISFICIIFASDKGTSVRGVPGAFHGSVLSVL